MTRLAWAAPLAGALALSALPRTASAEECGDVLIVLDRSGSMAVCSIDGKTKEAIAKDALNMVLSMYATIPMGLEVFPDTLTTCSGDACAKGKIVIEIAADGAKKIMDYLAKMPTSCGGTPTGSSMEIARDYDKWTPMRTHYALLLTDGQPTCQDGDNPGDGGAPVACDGKGCTECQNPFKVYDAIKALKDKGTKTFVVGFAGMGADACKTACTPTGMAFNPATLNRMADEGGVPNDDPSMPGTHFYSATNADTLKEALKKIVGKIAGGTMGGCVKGGGGSGGSGAGGSGAAGGGSGGSGAAGGSGGAGAQGGDTGGDGGTSGSRGGSPSCLCTLPGGPVAAGLGIGAPLAFWLGAVIVVRRRRRQS